MKVTSNAAEASKQFEDFQNDFWESLQDGMRRVLQYIGILSAKEYLHGPRPRRLDIGRTQQLIRAMLGGPGFSGGVKTTGAPAVSSANSIRSVTRSGDKVIGEIGVRNLPYADMWETTGHGTIVPIRKKALHFFTHDGREVFTKRVSAQGPRPFLKPAGEQAVQSGRLDEILMEAFSKLAVD